MISIGSSDELIKALTKYGPYLEVETIHTGGSSLEVTIVSLCQTHEWIIWDGPYYKGVCHLSNRHSVIKSECPEGWATVDEQLKCRA